MSSKFIESGGKLVEAYAPLPSVDILVLAAHNDDEMFPAGYLLNRIKEGKKVGVVVATDGAGSNYKNLPPEKLVPLRTEESRCAIEQLGGSFFVGCGYSSRSLAPSSGVDTIASELIDIVDAVHPSVFLVQSPFENHPTHLRVTDAGIAAARRAKHRILMVKGYEVWTPLHGIAFVESEMLDATITARKFYLQGIYESQNAENHYPEATRGLNLFNFVMADAHISAQQGASELYLDMTPLVHDGRFVDVSIVDYGGGLLFLTQMMRSHLLFHGAGKKELSRERMLDLLIEECIPAYRRGVEEMMGGLMGGG